MESRATAAAAKPHGRREALMGNTATRARLFVVRSATAADVPAIAAIYDYLVAHGTASFDDYTVYWAGFMRKDDNFIINLYLMRLSY